MRRILLSLVALAACRGSEPTPRYLTVGTDVAAAAHLVTAETHDGVAIVEVAADTDLEAISAIAHDQFHRCGGFMVHDSLAEAHAALAPPVVRATPDYTLDRADVVRAVLPTLDRAQLLGTIRELSAMPTRYYRSEGGAAASTWLAARWQRLAAGRPDVTVELVDQGWPQKSVVLTIPGRGRASEVVVLGGHLDSINLRYPEAPGADDDASGVATVTEVVRVLLASDYHPERTIQVMAYAAEEVGLRGSQEIVRDYKKRNVDVVGVLQLDMTNYQGSDKDIWLMKDFTNAAQNTFVTNLIDTYVGATWGLDACGYGCSDHASWYRGGFPASMPFEARFRDANKKIHSRADTLETSGDNADHAIKFARLGTAFAIELGKGGVGATIAASPPVSSGGSHRWWLALAGLGAVGLMLRRRRVS
ncbi:MAG: M20/M25/M40 family metallo-hydrolase [Proteobacteria bacterium]|nr:M20/M25/M40 family metallo-hydrolase [Pseudomonadota bacterium]